MTEMFATWTLVVGAAICFSIIIYLVVKIQKDHYDAAVLRYKEHEEKIKNEVNATSIDDLIAAENSSEPKPPVKP